jgi:ABC-2 type transport system permease protein
VAELLGGADYGTLTGWMRREIGAVYGPLVIAATAITGAAALTAGEEEDGILGLVLAHPVERSHVVLAKGTAVASSVCLIALGTWLGLIGGVAIAGGGIGFGELAALAIHLTFFGFAVGSLALALAAATGRRTFATAGAAGFALLGFLINGFAPLIDAIAWLK